MGLWTYQKQQRQPLRITSLIGASCNMNQISSFRMWFRLEQTWGDSSFNDSDSDSDSSTPFNSDSSHLCYDSDSNIIFMNDSDSDSYSIPTAALLILWFWLQNYINSDLNTRPDVNIHKMIYAQKIKHGFLSVHLYLKNCWKLSCLFCLM